MSEQNKPFVVTDRRKFTLDGQPRPDADPSPEREHSTPAPEAAGPQPIAAVPPPAPHPSVEPPAIDTPNYLADAQHDDDLPPPLTPEQIAEARLAYEQTVDRLDTAIRASNPGIEHAPALTFDRLIQSVYMTTIMQLGGSAPEGEQPRVDLMGARQSIDMLAVLDAKTAGNLASGETRLLDSALFELRLAFLEVTQALARSAAAKGPGTFGQQPGRPGPGGPGGPSIVR